MNMEEQNHPLPIQEEYTHQTARPSKTDRTMDEEEGREAPALISESSSQTSEDITVVEGEENSDRQLTSL